MKRSRGSLRNFIEGSSSEDEKIPPKKPHSPFENPSTNGDSSSSESDIETYLHKPEKLDLNSTFFNSKALADFEKIESNIFSGVTRISDSESDTEQKSANKTFQDIGHTSSNESNNVYTQFDSFQNYTKQIEEAKKYVENYNSKMTKVTENQADIFNLLSAGEGKLEEHKIISTDLHSSDFDSCDSEQEGWEEIQNVEKEKSLIPAEGLQVIVNLPENVKKKKGIDLLAAMKRRLNRIRKENQILVHKVHLLCWIAHGNYVNSVINSTEILAAALSLMPSEQSFPSERIDLTYLEKIVAWFKKSQNNLDKAAPENMDLKQCLQDQMKNKEAYNKKMLALIFVAILRSFGVQTRLVLSLQVEPLRPPAADLHYEGSSKARDQRNKVKDTLGTPVKAGPSQVKINIQKATPVKKKKSAKELGEESKKLKSSPVKQKRRTKSVESADADKDGGKIRKLPEDVGGRYVNSTENLKTNSAKTSDNIKKSSARKPSQDKTAKELPMPKSRKSSTNRVVKDTTSKNMEISQNMSQSSSSGSTQNDLKIPKTRSFSKRAESLQSKRSSRTNQTPTTVEKPASKPKSHSSTKKAETKTKKTSKNIQQLDGLYSSDSDDETWLLQLDGANDKPTKKPNLQALKSKTETSIKVPTKRPEKRPNLRVLKVKKAVNNVSDSDSEFEPSGGATMKMQMDEAVSLFKKRQKGKTIGTNNQDIKKDIVKLVKGSILAQSYSQRNSSRLASKRKSTQLNSDDSDYLPEPIKKKHHDSEDDFMPKTKVKRRVQVKPELQDNGEKKKKQGNDIWVEVFLDCEEKWICVDIAFGQVHCIKEIVQRASHPITYVVAWDNNNNLKDVTQRYCPNFNTVTRKLRADGKWWSESLSPFKALPTARDREEDEDLSRQQKDQPLPKAISEYKNHPLYVLRRHLLKFEALYPPEPPTLGFIRGEAVYPRNCVYTLHSRDIWLKQAKVVKMREEPYKIVKARPRWDKLSNQIITDQLLEIFGPWQVEDYVPPTAENGVVPRNAFGNVDLFKSCMLPKGCVHLKLPGLNKVAKRLNIDCASAITGFDFHGGWSHPIYDGFVVCEEFKDQLVTAWEEEQDELDRKEQEKIDKRVYGNWKRLIRGLLIRERLKIKYNFSEPSTSAPKSKKGKVAFCTKKK
ncbi:DNA repair protein complementing XP-C cells homolog [Euwallacea fornicatus]|uniref:DNA repair protein complementing XP-C cells homolog n=1 Tax=Euwallacea fornicatus TaxID=995702 RepID=UPI00338E7164